jgi:hypothetical protein
MRKRILFLTNDNTDYLSDSIFHGLRSLLGESVVDYPKADRMYTNAPRELIESLRGHGFTLYGLLEDIPVERPTTLTPEYIRENFDLIVVADIWRQVRLFEQIRPELTKENSIILDGADVPSLYKYAGTYWRNRDLWDIPSAADIPYYKRELMPETLVYRCFMLLPKSIAAKLMRFAPWRKMAFAIPAEKIVTSLPAKDKLMASHIVDPEVAPHFAGAGTGYAFNTEAGYYGDLQRSKFGITTKRAGWDCLRHYELAANACVPCVRDLDTKSEYCAPHGFNRSNCVVYTSLPDLLSQIETMSEERYAELQQGTLAWARSNTTAFRAMELLFSSGHSEYLLDAKL